ncbi:MAG: hypothetical protein WCL13_02930 [bacterium]
MLKLKKIIKEDELTGSLKLKIDNFLINYLDYLILAVAAIILVLGLWLFIYPQYLQIVQDENARKKIQTEYENELDYFNFIVDFKKSYQSISEENKNKLAGMVPTQSDINGLIYIIEAIASKNGVVLNSLKVEPEIIRASAAVKAPAGGNKEPTGDIFEQLPPGVGRVKIEVNLSAVNYQVLKNVIKTFENNLRLLDIAKISYNFSESKVNLLAYSYYLP